MVRVILAEDHKVVRQGTRLYLENTGIDVVGEATTGHEAIALTHEHKPDVVIMDINMPELTGIEATRRIRSEIPDVRVLVLTAYDEPAYIRALLDAGADGFVLKTAELDALYHALKEVAVGRRAFDQGTLDRAEAYNEAHIPIGEGLTDRELDVLKQARRGLTNKRIGEELLISARTVQGHLQNIYQKMNVTTRTEAVNTALKLGLIPFDEEPRR